MIASMQSIACCFKTSSGALGALSLFEAILLPTERLLSLCNILRVLFQVGVTGEFFASFRMGEGAISSLRWALNAFTSKGDGVFVELLMILWMLLNAFLFSRGWLTQR